MKHVHFFQYNVPADNHSTGRTDIYIDVIGTWHAESFYSDGRPITIAVGANLTFYDCLQVSDWHKAYREITAIVQNHFEVLAREERINQARAILAVEENPVLNCYEQSL
jgi:hypothetical protein